MLHQSPETFALTHPASHWTGPVKVRFLDCLSQRGNARLAARQVGLSPETAYRQRRRDPVFARAWAAALELSRRESGEVLADRAIDGIEEDVWYRGEVVGTRRRYDTRLLLAHLARLDRLAGDNPAAAADAERFDELLAVIAGDEPDEELADPDGDPLPPCRETLVREAAEQAARAVEESWDDEADEAGTLEDDAYDLYLEERNAAEDCARREARALSDAWVARAHRAVDAVLAEAASGADIAAMETGQDYRPGPVHSVNTPPPPSRSVSSPITRKSRRPIDFVLSMFYTAAMPDAPPPVRGRGAQSAKVPDRFGLAGREADGDWRDAMEALDGPPVKLRTTVTEEHPKTILTFNQSPDVGFDRSINAYRGCEHGCIYCFARPTHAFHDLSPGLDFETKLFAKPDAARLLRETLAKPRYRPKPIAMGTNTDPYQPIEGRYRITRQLLEVCLDARHPVTITTKSDRVLQDLDLLGELAKLGLVAVAVSVTSLDPRLSRLLEPRATAPAKRLAALGRLVEAGVPVHCSVAPIVPAITDAFMEEIVARAGALGVRSAGWIPLRLPYEVAPLFREWLSVHFPERADKVMAIVRSIRGGRDNDPGFFSRMRPSGVWADLFRTRFRLARRRAGMERTRFELDCTLFRAPEIGSQLRLL